MARTRYQEGELIPFKTRRRSGWIARWRIDVLENGKVERRYKTERLYKEDYPTEKLARRRVDELVAEVNDPGYRARPTATIREFSQLYINDVLEHHKGSGQSTDRSRINNHIVPLLGDVQLKDISGQIVQQFVTALRRQHKRDRQGKKTSKLISAKTVINVYKVLSSMWTTARAWGYVKGESFDAMQITLPEVVTPEQRCYTPEECVRLITHAGYPWGVLFYILAQAGIRIGEALGLHVDDVDLERRLLIVRRSVWRGKEQTPKSRKAWRVIELSPKLTKMIADYLEGGWEPCEANLLFHTSEGTPIDYNNFRKQVLLPLKKELGIVGGCFHAFRHGNISMLGHSNTPMKTLKDRVGHVDEKTTMGYMHTISEDGRRAAEMIDAMLFEEEGTVQ